MGLSTVDRKDLESLLKAASKDPEISVGISRRLIPSQGEIDDFAYGFSSGMVVGNFMAQFQNRHGRELDRDEIADLFSILANRMPRLRQSIIKHLEMR
jgi:hypothetical protein